MPFVQFYNSCPFRGDECYVILDFVEYSFVVHIDVFERRIEQVAQQTYSAAGFFVKEPISTKGPRLTSELSFAGRYLVLIPFNDKVSVSQKIKSSEERARLKQLLMSIKPKNFGVIVRTVAEGKRVAELDGELKVLLKHWEEAIVKVQKATKFPTLIYEETSRAVGLLRDLFNPSFGHGADDDAEVFRLDTHQQLLEACALFARFNFL